jgi:hypothetical protein
VIPGTALGVVFVVAALGPGYLYLRVAERRNVRHERSGLVEAVELAVVGAFASTVSLLAVTATADAVHLIDVHRLSAHWHSYLAEHPLRILWLVTLALATAYCFTYLAVRIMHWGQPVSIELGTAWTQAFKAARDPESGLFVYATVELRDGRQVDGVLRAHSTEVGDNRELLLGSPLQVRVGADQPKSLGAEIVLLREVDVRTLSAQLIQAGPKKPRKSHWWTRTRSG